MSALAWGERLRIVAVTAILTSAGWVAFGGPAIESVRSLAVLRKVDGQPGASTTSDSGKAAPAHRTVESRSPIAAGEYLLPVAGVRPEDLSDTFADARGGGTRVHEAIDIMAERGTPVLAATPGTVEKLFSSKAGGLTIYIRSPDRRTITYYAHLYGYAPGLADRQPVRQGQQLGTVGSTGNADPAAPHLHFAIFQTTPEAGWWEPAHAINPYPVLRGR